MASKTRKSGEVLVYEGKRGKSFRIRYTDGSGRRVKETLGSAQDGWNAKRAEEALQDRLSDVRRSGYRAPDASAKFGPFAEEWVETYIAAKGLKHSTAEGYRHIVRDRLVPAFGTRKVGEIDTGRIEREVGQWTADGLQASTVNNALNCLSLILKAARKRRMISGNPVEDVDRPRARARERRVLTPPEIARVARAFERLIERGTGSAVEDLQVARIAFLVLVDTAVRRGELLGLRWGRVLLADPNGPRLRIEEAFTRNRWTEPKSAAGRRTIALSEPVAEALFEYRATTPHKADSAVVVCNWRTGHPIEPHKLADLYRAALTEAEIENPHELDLFHNIRHAALTIGAESGMSPAALQAKAGHASYATTRGYIEDAALQFQADNDRYAKRLWGSREEAPVD
jgi:integrase